MYWLRVCGGERQIQGAHQIRLEGEEVAFDRRGKRAAEEDRGVEWLKKDLQFELASRGDGLEADVRSVKVPFRKLREHAAVRQAVDPGFSIIPIVGDASKVQWLLLRVVTRAFREFHSA